jgi:hypothetical protein
VKDDQEGCVDSGACGCVSAAALGVSADSREALVNTWVPRQVAVNRQLDADLAQRNRQAASDRSQEYSALYGEVNAATPPQRYATAHAELLASLGHSMNAADAFANGSDDLFVQESEAAAAALNRYNAAAKELGAGTEY